MGVIGGDVGETASWIIDVGNLREWYIWTPFPGSCHKKD